MKRSTMQNKLAELLGLDQFKVDAKTGQTLKDKNTNVAVGITEEELQEFRAAQGLSYFLQAPELFTPKVCPHCGEGFLVSRQYVKFCSWTCIRKDLEERGLVLNKGEDLESFIERKNRDAYEGNEPLWIRDLDKLKSALEKLAALENIESSSPSTPPSEASTSLVGTP